MASILKVDTIQQTSGTNAMSIDSSGRPTFPNRPAFEAWYTGSNMTFNSGSNAGLTYNNVEQQGGTNFSTATGKFTVPITGIYFFSLLNNTYDVDANKYFRHGVLFNGTGFGMVANHSLVMASYISRANAGIIDLRDLLSKG